jgi:hypothetical protein
MESFPRFTVWFLVIALLAEAACLGGEPPRQPDAPSLKCPRTREAGNLGGNRQAVAPEPVLERFKVAIDGGLLLLPVELQGKRYLFALDTGASHCFYDTSLRSLLGKPIRSVKMRTPDRDITVPIFRSPQGKVGKFSLPTDSEAFCMDLGKIREGSGQEIYGLLGMDFLKKHVFRIDFDAGEVTFLRSVGPNPGQRLPIMIQGNCPYVMIEAHGLLGRGRFLIDTGSGGAGSGCLQASAFAVLAKRGCLTLVGQAHSESLSGSTMERVGRVGAISLGDYRHEKLLFAESRRNVLGLNYWSRYVVTFDFPNSTLYLKKGRQFDRPDLRDMSGLTLLRRKGQTLVESVDEGSPAAQAGVKPRDVLIKIDDVKASETSLSRLNRLLCAEGKKRCLLIRRGEKEVAKTIDLRDW